MVAPGGTESVAEDPSQKGGLFGYTVDGNWDTYDPNDPNTPEGKQRILQERLSELNRRCWATAEMAKYRTCSDNCSNAQFTADGRILPERAQRCRDECEAAFEQNKPQVCREADAVQAQLEALR
jgi:hypothetical protein